VVAWQKLPVVRITGLFRVSQLGKKIIWQVSAGQGIAATAEYTKSCHFIHCGAVLYLQYIASHCDVHEAERRQIRQENHDTSTWERHLQQSESLVGILLVACLSSSIVSTSQL